MTRSLLLPLVLIVAACGGADATPIDDATRAIPVRVALPQFRKDLPPIVLTGTLGAKEEVPLAFKIGGIVTRVAVEAGQAVREGDVLAELSLTEIDGQVSAAREGLAKARRDYARAERLHADSVVTLAQLQDARTGFDVAEAQANAAEFNRQYAVIRAPASGVVQRRSLEAGQLVSAGTSVIFLRTERKGLVLRAAAADRDAVRIDVGARATLSFDAYPGEQFAGTVERVGVAASPTTGTYEVEISVDPERRRFVSGLIGHAELRPKSASNLSFIPAEALLEVDGVNAAIFVLGADGTHVERRLVRVAFLDHGFAALVGALDASAQVVTAGATRLSEGSAVTVATERAP